VAWITGQVETRRKHFDQAIRLFEKILDPGNQPRERKFDFTRDYIVINALAKALFDRAQDKDLTRAERAGYLGRAVERYESTLKLDLENPDAHLGLGRCYQLLSTSVPSLEPPPLWERDMEVLALARKAFAGAPFLTWKEIRAAKARGGLVVITASEKAGMALAPRQEAADDLIRVIDKFLEVPADQDATRFGVLLDLVALCAPVTNYLEVDVKEQDGVKVGKVLRSPETLALQAAAKKIVTRLQLKADAVLRNYARTVADEEQPGPTRKEAAAHLFSMVLALGKPSSVAEFPKVPLFQSITPTLRGVYLKDDDDKLRGGAALILGRIHAVLHLIYKPDDEAAAIVGKAREKPEYEAASKASDPVVIYPLSRK
jgi:tetratricopeptide (TPR) repeat protein